MKIGQIQNQKSRTRPFVVYTSILSKNKRKKRIKEGGQTVKKRKIDPVYNQTKHDDIVL